MPNNKETLEASTDMEAIQGTIDVDIPIATLWECFTHANWWPRWNTCMYLALNQTLDENDQLIWAFDPIRWWYPYKLPGKAKIVEVQENSHVTWEVTVLPGFYALWGRLNSSVRNFRPDRRLFSSQNRNFLLSPPN